jgi:hypothetical protein
VSARWWHAIGEMLVLCSAAVRFFVPACRPTYKKDTSARSSRKCKVDDHVRARLPVDENPVIEIDGREDVLFGPVVLRMLPFRLGRLIFLLSRARTRESKKISALYEHSDWA